MHRSVRSKCRQWLTLSSGVVAGLSSLSPLMAQTAVNTITLPPANKNATGPYSATSALHYNSTGTLFAWDGQTVYEQASTLPSAAFDPIGTAPAGNHADPGPIRFSANGSQILFANGAGGNNSGGTYIGQIFSLPTPASVPVANVSQGTLVQNIPYSYDIIPVPVASTLSGSGTNYFVDAGSSSFTSSSVSIFNTSSSSTLALVKNIPGASASMAYNPLNNSLYVENGYDSGNNGPGGTNDTGDIRVFSLTALAAGPMNFSQGTLFDPTGFGVQSGTDLFFDKDGYLFSDGSDGIVVFNSSGGIVYKQDPSGSYVDDLGIAYNPVTDQVLQSPPSGSNTASLYNAVSFEPAAVPEPTTLGLLTLGASLMLGRRRERRVRGC